MLTAINITKVFLLTAAWIMIFISISHYKKKKPTAHTFFICSLAAMAVSQILNLVKIQNTDGSETQTLVTLLCLVIYITCGILETITMAREEDAVERIKEIEQKSARIMIEIAISDAATNEFNYPKENNALAYAAMCYAYPKYTGNFRVLSCWPFDTKEWKPYVDYISNLAKSAALLCGEANKLQNKDLSDKKILIEAIEERFRQMEDFGHSPREDANKRQGELALAAICYADPEKNKVNAYKRNGERIPVSPLNFWPWPIEKWNPTPEDRISELRTAIALLIAEMDRETHENISQVKNR